MIKILKINRGFWHGKIYWYRLNIKKIYRYKINWQIFNLIILISVISVNINAKENNSRPWKIYWSFTDKNAILNGPFSIGANGIQKFFKDQGNYNVSLEFKSNLLIPNVENISLYNHTAFWVEIKKYIDILRSRWEIDENPNEDISILIGISQMKNCDNRYGVTIPKLMVGNNISITFIFVERLNMERGSSESRISRLDYIILHELCHARGMNASTLNERLQLKSIIMSDSTSDPCFDHIYHKGNNQDSCIMHSFIELDPPLPYILCDYHKRILRNCLQRMQPTYSVSDTCCGLLINQK